MSDLTLEQQATNNATREHIAMVTRYIHVVVRELLRRSEKHDLSKLGEPEVQTFTEMTPKLRDCEYGSEKYKGFLAEMKPALDHHYANNRHHPEHHPDGVGGMNLVDILEMFLDWKASTLRHNSGNIRKSIEHNATRFNLSPQLQKILFNTIELVEGED